MFINVDYNKRAQKAKLKLAKPNKVVIDSIHEAYRGSLKVKLGSIHELNFSIPFELEGERNAHIDTIKEKMLIKIDMGSYRDWFVVTEISEDGDDSDIFNVTAFSLGYELRDKKISIEEESINATNALTKALSSSIWSIGYVHPMFDAMFRALSLESSNGLDAVLQIAETFGALLEWDNQNRKINLQDLNADGRFRGMTVSYGRLIRSIKRTRTTDDMVTRLHIKGNEGLTIHGVNPTGMGYIEDFSYFMYPFEKDANGNVIKSSYFMSNELCLAIENHKSMIELHSPEINSILDSKIEKETELMTKESELTQLNFELTSILALLDIAQATGDTNTISLRKQERNAKQVEVDAKQSQVDTLKSQVNNLQAQIELRQVDISYDTNFTPALLDELNLYIVEKEWVDDRYTDPVELYEDGIKKFNELRQPKVVIDVNIDNLLNIIEEQYYWDKLVLGDLIKVKYPQMNIQYMAKIIEMDFDLENGEANLVIANTSDLLNESEKLIKLLYSNSSASTLIQNNKYKWDKINAVSDEVGALLTQEWDANKNKITAGVNNSIEVGNRGIIIRNPDFPEEVLIIQSGILALSMDDGETWKTAIKPDGIVAERLIGKIIAGQELFITNSAGTFTFDNNGVYIDAESFVVRSSSSTGGINLRDVWNGTTDFVDAFKDDNMITPYEKKMLKIEWDKIKVLYDSMAIKLNGYYDDQGMSVPEVVAFHQKYQALFSYLFEDLQTDGNPLLGESSMNQTTRIDRIIFDSRFKEYDASKVKVDEILSLRAKDLADDAKEVADDARRSIDDVMNDVVYKLEIHSSKGFVFKNGIIDTVVTARVYRGTDNITATLPDSAFIWKKYDKNGIIDTAWNASHEGVGNVISLNERDVIERATINCDIFIAE